MWQSNSENKYGQTPEGIKMYRWCGSLLTVEKAIPDSKEKKKEKLR